MRISVDTNVLVRAVVQDDPEQGKAAADVLRSASFIAVPLPALCEFVWVLLRVYKFSGDDVSAALEALMRLKNLAANRPAVEAGLAMLKAGGDFADGVIAFEGRWLGGATFVSFDRKAVLLAQQQGLDARLLP